MSKERSGLAFGRLKRGSDGGLRQWEVSVKHRVGPDPQSSIIVSEYDDAGSFYLELSIAEMFGDEPGFERDFRAAVLATASSVKGVTQILEDDRHTWAVETEIPFKPTALVKAVKSELFQGDMGRALTRYLDSLMDDHEAGLHESRERTYSHCVDTCTRVMEMVSQFVTKLDYGQLQEVAQAIQRARSTIESRDRVSHELTAAADAASTETEQAQFRQWAERTAF